MESPQEGFDYANLAQTTIRLLVAWKPKQWMQNLGQDGFESPSLDILTQNFFLRAVVRSDAFEKRDGGKQGSGSSMSSLTLNSVFI